MTEPVDLTITNANLLTMVDGYAAVRGSVTVSDGKIVSAGAINNPLPPSRRVIDARGGAVMPGFVNCHTHNASNMLLRSLDEDVELWEWLRSMWSMKKNFDPDTLYWASLCGLVEMASSGITCFNEHFDAYAVEPEIHALEQIPLRATLGYGFADRGLYEPIAPWSWRALKSFGSKVSAYSGAAGGRLQVALSPHAPYSVGRKMWELVREVANEYQVPIHTHLAEGLNESRYMRDNYGTTTVQWLESLGILGPDMTAAHCTQLNEFDISLLAERGVKVAHCPISNAKLTSGTMNIGDLMKAGITIGLATDGPASHNTLDMFEEMKFAALFHKARTMDPTFLKAKQILQLATRGAAEAMQRSRIGCIAPGAPADLIVVDMDVPHALPGYNIEPTLIYSSRANDVRYTIVDGHVILDDRQVVGVDVAQIRHNFRDKAIALRERSL